jgi:hypothetical protein
MLVKASHNLVCMSLLVVMTLTLSACGGGSGRPGPNVTQRQVVDRLTIALERPAAPHLLDEQDLFVTLTGEDGKPVDGAEVWLGMLMPTMRMSPNEPDAIPAGAGRYRITALFTMAGNWNLEVHATIQRREHIAVFMIPVT